MPEREPLNAQNEKCGLRDNKLHIVPSIWCFPSMCGYWYFHPCFILFYVTLTLYDRGSIYKLKFKLFWCSKVNSTLNKYRYYFRMSLVFVCNGYGKLCRLPCSLQIFSIVTFVLLMLGKYLSFFLFYSLSLVFVL